jgi:O-antigen ligase
VPRVAHNAYLESLADLGVVGLLTFLAVLGLTLRAAVLATRTFERLGDRQMELVSRAVVVSLSAVLVANLFVSGEYEKYMWLLIALCPALLALARRATAELEP